MKKISFVVACRLHVYMQLDRLVHQEVTGYKDRPDFKDLVEFLDAKARQELQAIQVRLGHSAPQDKQVSTEPYWMRAVIMKIDYY